MPDDVRTVPVTFQLDPQTATALEDPATRARIERLIRQDVRRHEVQELFAAMRALSEEARRRGLTEEILNAELEAYNAERRDGPTPA